MTCRLSESYGGQWFPHNFPMAGHRVSHTLTEVWHQHKNNNNLPRLGKRDIEAEKLTTSKQKMTKRNRARNWYIDINTQIKRSEEMRWDLKKGYENTRKNIKCQSKFKLFCFTKEYLMEVKLLEDYKFGSMRWADLCFHYHHLSFFSKN